MTRASRPDEPANSLRARLIRPSKERKSAFFDMASEFDAHGDPRYRDALGSFSDYLAEVLQLESGMALRPHFVRTSEFWLESDGKLVGGSRLRHALNDRLHCDGGNIGYDVRPSARGRGFGHRILELTLFEARRTGLTRVLLTCAVDNAVSLSVIRAAGGVADGTAISPITGDTMLRSWIALAT